MALLEALDRVRDSQKHLAITDEQTRNHALGLIRDALWESRQAIFDANRRDIELAEMTGVSRPILKRLKFDEQKLIGVMEGIDQIIALRDPLHRLLEARSLDEGLILRRVTAPIGVIGMIFESRPDALVQIASLCLKSGNGIVLKGGSEALNTNRALYEVFRTGSIQGDVSESVGPDWILLLETRDEVKEMLSFSDHIDLVIPRGSNEFVSYIMANTSIPVLGHADGICHAYVHADADIPMALRIVIDAKCQYPAVCNAIETLIIHKDIAERFLPPMGEAFHANGVTIKGDDICRSIIACEAASEEDWSTEYLDLIISIKVVSSLEEAVDHINTYGSGHTDTIVTSDVQAAEFFMNAVDSADVFWNCSTRFADGFRFGLGAEVGISTQRIHARGPVGLEGLITYKWRLQGTGQCVSDYVLSAGNSTPRTFTFKELPLEDKK